MVGDARVETVRVLDESEDNPDLHQALVSETRYSQIYRRGGSYGDEEQCSVYHIEQQQSLSDPRGAFHSQYLTVELGDHKSKDENEQLLKGNAAHVDMNP